MIINTKTKRFEIIIKKNETSQTVKAITQLLHLITTAYFINYSKKQTFWYLLSAQAIAKYTLIIKIIKI